MDGLLACASYPGDLGQDEPLDADVAEGVAERRSDLFTLLKNAARVAAADVHVFVADRLQRALSSGANASFQVRLRKTRRTCKTRNMRKCSDQGC